MFEAYHSAAPSATCAEVRILDADRFFAGCLIKICRIALRLTLVYELVRTPLSSRKYSDPIKERVFANANTSINYLPILSRRFPSAFDCRGRIASGGCCCRLSWRSSRGVGQPRLTSPIECAQNCQSRLKPVQLGVAFLLEVSDQQHRHSLNPISLQHRRRSIRSRKRNARPDGAILINLLQFNVISP